jgi:RNA polymerase sigma factor (TIGR02999 family)
MLYDELRALARGMMHERGDRGNMLQTTALVHEAFLKMSAGAPMDFENKAHFFGVAAKAMRSVVVDHYRASRAQKRGGARPIYTIATSDIEAVEGDGGADARLDLLELERALNSLEAIDTRKARLVELRFYAGLTNAQTAEVLGLSHATVEREWRLAKAFLKAALEGDSGVSDL